MILYFSGTGNSEYVAKLVAEKNCDTLVSMNDLIKHEKTETLNSEKPFVFVAPVYAWRLPKIITKFIQNTTFEGNNKFYFILTCGKDTGNAVSYIRTLCNKKNIIFMGLSSIVMPDNYLLIFPAIKESEAKTIVENTSPNIEKISKLIMAGEKLAPENVSISGKIMSGPVNALFYKFIVSAKGFRAEDICTGCGICATLCPLNNITMVESKPVWSKNCTHCMACICKCPVEAIEYKNKTKGRRRYFLEALNIAK